MAAELLLLVQVLVATLLLGLALWLVWVDFSNPIHRAFALFFVLRGGHLLINQWVRLDPSTAEYLGRIRGYFLLGLAAALLNLFIVYNWRRPTTATRVARAGLAVFVLTIELLYLWRHELLSFVHPTEGTTFGPLGIFTQAFLPLLALTALWFAVAASKTSVPAQARFHRLLALGFCAMATADGILAWSIPPTEGWGPILAPYDHLPHVMAQSMYIITAPIALAAFIILFRTTPAGPPRAWTAAIVAFCAILPFTGGLLSDTSNDHTLERDFWLFFLPLGVARLTAASILAYALVRQSPHRVDAFALDYRVKISISRGTIGGILVATFFVISNVAQELIPELLGGGSINPFLAQAIGASAAGLLLLSMNPLRRLGDRVSTSVLPTARPQAKMTDEDRIALYAEQASIAWADGALTRKERILLDRLKVRLALDAEQVSVIERRAAESAPAA